MRTARLVAARPATTTPASVHDLLAALREGLSGRGPAVAPHPPERAPSPAVGPGRPLETGEDSTADPTAAVVTTSGSTDDPKATLLPASALLASAAATHDRLGGPGAWLLAVPPHTVAGVLVCVRAAVAGGLPAVCDLRPGFRPDAFATAAAAQLREHPGRRYTALVAAQVRRLLDAGGVAASALAGFDAVLVGGGPVPPGLREEAATAGVRLVATYGASETTGGCVYDGRALDGVRIDVATDGRVRVAGATVARGYRGRPGHPAFDVLADGTRRVTTDDLGRLADGVLTVLGRVDDVVVTGGYKVSGPAVADSLRRAPGVRDAAVVGVPDPRWGQRVAAVVVPSDDTHGRELDPQALRARVATDLGRWAAPDVHLVPDLPRLGPGKVDRRALVTIVTGRSDPRGPDGRPGEAP